MYQASSDAFARGSTQVAGGTPAQQAAELISRYPNLSEIELARLINLYRQLSALDAALIISDRDLAPRLDRFFGDHRSKVKPPFRQYAALVGYALIGIAAFVWALIRV